jgi:hypothetical protein
MVLLSAISQPLQNVGFLLRHTIKLGHGLPFPLSFQQALFKSFYLNTQTVGVVFSCQAPGNIIPTYSLGL